MKITTWNVNQFCGNKDWTKIDKLEKEKIYYTIMAFMLDEV